MAGPTVLFVDDERNILQTLRRLFFEEAVEVLIADSGEEGLQKMASAKVALVLSDYKMPGMSGAEFLAHVREQFPDTTRILMTGYADTGTAMEAINRGEVYRFVMKPWDNNELLLTVRQGLERYDLLMRNQVLTQSLAEKNRELERLNRDLEHRVEERTQELKAMNELLQYMLEVHPDEEALERIVTVAAQVLSCEAVGVYLSDSDGDRQHPEVGCAFIEAPIEFLNKQLGVMQAHQPRNQTDFTEDSRKILKRFATLASMAIRDSAIQEDTGTWKVAINRALQEFAETQDPLGGSQ